MILDDIKARKAFVEAKVEEERKNTDITRLFSMYFEKANEPSDNYDGTWVIYSPSGRMSERFCGSNRGNTAKATLSIFNDNIRKTTTRKIVEWDDGFCGYKDRSANWEENWWANKKFVAFAETLRNEYNGEDVKAFLREIIEDAFQAGYEAGCGDRDGVLHIKDSVSYAAEALLKILG